MLQKKINDRDKDAILIFDELCLKKSFIFHEVTGQIDRLVQIEQEILLHKLVFYS